MKVNFQISIGVEAGTPPMCKHACGMIRIMNNNLKLKIFKITVLFSLLLIGATVILFLFSKADTPEDSRSKEIIDCNEISRLIEKGSYDEAVDKLDAFRDNLQGSTVIGTSKFNGVAICVLAIVFMLLVFLYVYVNILKPFDKMKDFAAEIANGNFNVPLKYERSNYFGAFTWAFDSMRKEIMRSRAAEHEAIENNKTVIATLSHDIKTPIASIRAYAEGLEANLDKSPERRRKYLEVLMRKCDEVTSLTNDLFLHSLSDMGKIEIKPEEFELTSFMEQEVSELAAERGDVFFRKPEFTATVSADKKRLTQLVENLINNSRKYAKTDINISMTEVDGAVKISFLDRGAGIPDEDMPFITDKFYRGRNCGNENGSGLGLYIVKYITEQSGGELELKNLNPGLEVIVTLPIVSKASP